MLNFQPLTLSEFPLLRHYFENEGSRICDRSAGGAMMWRFYYQTEYCDEDGALFLRIREGNGQYAYLVPAGESERGLFRLRDALPSTPVFVGVPAEELESVRAVFPSLSAIPTREQFDYLYLTDSLASFAGKKLSGQRNHRNFFLKSHTDWAFVPITEAELPELSAFFEHYCEQVQKDSPAFQAEREAVKEVLEHFREYALFGGAIRAEGKMVAFSFAEAIGDTIMVHIEKADREVRGAYQMMVSEFLRYYAKQEHIFVNREDDDGDEGLRYSKLSYHPERLLEKFRMEEQR